MIAEVGVEDVALQAFARLLHEFGDALETQTERLSERLLKRVALDRIVGKLGLGDRLPRKKPAAVHWYEAFFSLSTAMACWSLVISAPIAQFRLSVEWRSRGLLFPPCDCLGDWLDS